jgi:hypothetical protein
MAFLTSMEPMGGLNEEFLDSEDFHYARKLIERLAACPKDALDKPAIVMPLSDCAEILWFLTKIEPREKRDWWVDDSEDAPSPVVGLQIVLQAIEESIRRSWQSPTT